MTSMISSAVHSLWSVVIWLVTQVSRLVVVLLNHLLFPNARTGRPHPLALGSWLLVQLVLFGASLVSNDRNAQLYGGAVLAGAHFFVVVTALLVITEENDVWSGYVRFDPMTGKGDRVFSHGRILKSLPLIVSSGLFYFGFSAIAIRAWHSEHPIFNVPYYSDISIVHYLVTIAAQIPTLETLLKSTGLKPVAMEFRGLDGMALRYLIEISYASIIVGAVNSYFRQKSEIRRLVDALGSDRGNIPVLQNQASRAPGEIKTAILNMALHHSNAQVRWRAMTVAKFSNILTFPTTIAYNLHKEPREQNKRHAIEIAIRIVENNYGHLDRDYYNALVRSINFQLDKKKLHKQKTLDMLVSLRGMTQAYQK